MSELSVPWPQTSNPIIGDGRAYTDAEWRQAWRLMVGAADAVGENVLWTSGVGDLPGRLEVTSPANNQIRVSGGAALVDGILYVNNDVKSIEVGSASLGTVRWDRVVVRASWVSGEGQYTARAIIRTGDGLNPPALVQVRNGAWEISLARYRISDTGVITNLTDERQYSHLPTRVRTDMLDDNAVVDSSLRQSGACSVVGRSANTMGNVADIPAMSNDTLLRRVGNVLGFGVMTLAMIPDLLITGAKIAAAAITADKIATSAVTADKIADLSVTTTKIADNQVTNAKLRDSAAVSVIGRSTGTIGDPADIAAAADGQVLRRSGGALGFAQISSAELGALSVTAPKLADGAVTITKIADGHVSHTKLEHHAVYGDKIADGGIDAAKLADDAVTNDKLRNSVALSVIGRPVSTGGNPSDIVASSSNTLLRRVGNAIEFGVLTSAMVPSGILAHENMVNRSRRFFVPAQPGQANTTGKALWTGVELPNGVLCNVVGWAGLPIDFVLDTDPYVNAVFHAPVTGTIRCEMRVVHGVVGDPVGSRTATTGMQHMIYHTANRFAMLPGLGIPMVIGESFFGFEFIRDAAHGADTLEGTVFVLGWEVTYTADM